MIIRYASHNLRFIQPTQITSKSAPKFLPKSQENVCQPLCIGSWAKPATWSPKHTSSESRDIPLSPQINTARHTSSVLKVKTQSDKVTSRGKLNSSQESRWGRNIIRSNYNSKARDASRSCEVENTREREREIKHIATGTYLSPEGELLPPRHGERQDDEDGHWWWIPPLTGC